MHVDRHSIQRLLQCVNTYIQIYNIIIHNIASIILYYVIHDIFDTNSMLTFASRGKPQTNQSLHGTSFAED